MAETLKLGNGIWATKENSLLSYNDENGNYKPLPFDFTRASSATVVNKAGLIETVGTGIPRIDFLGNTNGSLLLEPQRTNNLLQSNQFDTTWSLSGATLTSGQIGVGGSNDAWILEKNISNGRVFQNLTSSGIQTFSVYAKSGTNNWVSLLINGGGNPTAYFDLQNGVVGNASGGVITSNIESAGNGWYKISITFNESITRTRIYVADSNGNTSQTSGNIYIQYAQLEAGSYPTSYIPTQGSTVTRVKDACLGAGNDQVINSTEGVLYVETQALVDNGLTRYLSLTDGTSSNRMSIVFGATTNQIRFLVYNGVVQADIQTFSYSQTAMNKIAFRYSQNNFSLWINGVKIGDDLIGDVFTLNTLAFDLGNNSLNWNGNTKDVRVYNTALTDAELQALTTI